jgi:hypothetical protein
MSKETKRELMGVFVWVCLWIAVIWFVLDHAS